MQNTALLNHQFPKALKHLQQGYMARRGEFSLYLCVDSGRIKTQADGGDWAPSQEDLLASDWELRLVRHWYGAASDAPDGFEATP